ncbi:transcriptional regulator, TetR family [Stigmatella aurantiaca]|uniref:Transcriptional regulator, TetR family n=1 Tax=Stigmatella aurantiaca TaxID=41 RepID=A0A1H7PCK8_STIAU|nr:TetR/AcrR family transcriptional regulator [Stigmatella aurantiaca]SEL32797.1 transcriptional regulator, TetR family [Stigmatella aurantiaca]
MVEGLRERNKRQKLEAAKKAARQLFARQGFEATTIRQIAERAGIGLGTLYSYVPNKHELLDLIFHEQWSAVEDAAYASLPADVGLVEGLLHVFGAMVDSYAKDPELSKTFLRETLLPTEGGETRRERSRQVLTRLAGLVERARERGEVGQEVDPLAAATNLFGLYLLHLLGWFGGLGNTAEFLERLRLSLELQMRGLRPAKPGSSPRRSRA